MRTGAMLAIAVAAVATAAAQESAATRPANAVVLVDTPRTLARELALDVPRDREPRLLVGSAVSTRPLFGAQIDRLAAALLSYDLR